MQITKRPVQVSLSVDGAAPRRMELTQVITASTQLLDQADIGDRLAIVRDGNIGDLLMLTPTLRELRRLYPELVLDLFVREPFLCLFDDNPHVSSVRPLSDFVEVAYPRVVDLRNFVERHPDAMSVDRHTLFARAFGFDHLPDYSMDYYLRDDEVQRAEDWLSANGIAKPPIIFHPDATDPRRSWTVPNMREFAELAVADGWDLIVNHANDGLKPYFEDMPLVHYYTGSLREMIALQALSAAEVCGDSGPVHTAAAVQSAGTPYIFAVFSIIPWRLRMQHYRNYRVFQAGHLTCCPCYEDTTWSSGCHRECMEVITGEMVYKAVKELLG